MEHGKTLLLAAATAALALTSAASLGATQRIDPDKLPAGKCIDLRFSLEFLDRHPEVRIDMRLADGFVDLVEQGLDVAVRVGHLADSSLVAHRIGTTQRRLVAHRDLVRRLRRNGPKPPRHPDELAAHDCLVYTELATRDQWAFVAGPGASVPPGTERSVRVKGRLQTNSSEVIRASVLGGHGIGYAPDWLFDAELASGEVVSLMPGWQTPPLPMHLVSPTQRQHSAKARAFGEFLRAALSGGGKR